MKRIVHYKAAKKNTLNVMASGLTNEEIEQIEALVKRIARKRSHGNRPKLLYDLIFND